MDLTGNKFSFSKVECYETCGFQYYLKYVEKHPVDSNSIALRFGCLVHETEEKIAQDIQAKRPVNYIAYKNNFLAQLAKLEHDFPEDFIEPDKSNRTYREKAYLYLNQNIYNLEKYMKAHPNYEIIGIEQAFSFEYKNLRFNGFIDRVFRDTATNKLIIQDIKTYNTKIDKKKLTTPLQFVFYCLAAEQLWGAKTTDISCQYYMPLIDTGLIQDAGTLGFVDRGKLKLNKLFTEIENEKFGPQPSPLCTWCSFSPTNKNALEENKKLCPYHNTWTKANKKYGTEFEWQGMEKHQAILEAYQKLFEN